MNSQFRKTIATLTLLTFLALLPMSCDTLCKNSCGCSSPSAPKDFAVLSFEALTLDQNRNEVTSSEFLPYNEVVKAIRIKETQTIAVNDQPYSFGAIPGVAYACSPIPPKSVVGIASIKIINTEVTTLNNGEALAIGDDLTSRFGINDLFENGSQTIPAFFSEKRSLYFDTFLKLNWISDPEGELKLDFSILIIMEDGKEFSLNQEKLSIK